MVDLRALSADKTKRNVLIVDDEQHILNLVRMSLDDEHFEVHGALNAREALQRVNEIPPDIIILDIMMPGINGYELCQAFRENSNTKDTPIVILSAKSQMGDKLHAIDVGADDYMTKPFDPVELLRRVKLNLNIAA